jgi:HD-GYP domain-containing protein (c-di-GMP phosphodiesterase class II)
LEPPISVEKRDLEALLEVSRQMVAVQDLDQLLDLVLGHATELLDAERSSLFVLNEDTGELWTTIAQGLVGRTIRVPLGKGIVGHVAQDRQALVIADAYEDPRFNRDVDRETGFRTRSILCCPMLNNQAKCIGVIEVLNKSSGGVFTPYDQELLQALASHAALAIENAQLHQEKEKLFRSVVRTLAAAIDARDPVTAGHSERVTRYALNLGEELGLDPDAMQVLELSANLHDVGKLAVRDDILLKTDQLTAAEFDQMKAHARFTRSILESIEFPRGLRRIPRVASLHHERVDGSGYPEGLDGDALEIVPRILAVADVYDALVSYDRPYKKAMTPDQALSILREGRGTHFDPEMVDLFIDRKLYQVERRDFQRVNHDFTIEYWVIPDARIKDRVVFAQALDVSASGMAFTSRGPIPAWTFLEMIIHVPGQTFDLIARVVRCEDRGADGFAVAVRFVNLTHDVKEILDHHVKEAGVADG